MYVLLGSLTEVINFDVDLMDSTVLSSVLLSYCPFLMCTHFSRLFIEPSSQEQCAHNAIIIIKALRYIGINYSIQQNDICSPNPIFMILFCAYLYSVLPSYKPVSSIQFSAPLSKTDEVKVRTNCYSKFVCVVTNCYYTVYIQINSHKVEHYFQIKVSNLMESKYSVLIRGENLQNFTSSQVVTVSMS